MADPENKDIHLLKRTKISVFVDEALPDILVVTYEFGVKSFKGVLLDSNKKNLPCGVQTLNPALNVPTKNDDDALYTVNQRFAYTDPSNAKKKNVNITSKLKNSKLSVRLRPRQVLCTKCKGVCNENSENVTRKRKPPEPIRSPPIKRSANAPITRSVNIELNKKKIEVKRTLLPKTRELPNALSGNVNKLNIVNNKKPLVVVSNLNCSKANICDSIAKTEPETNSIHSEEHSDVSNTSAAQKINDPKLKKLPRKKRSVGSIEEILDETNIEKGANKNNNVNAQNNANQIDAQPGTCSNTRTIKICYGPQGEGTVLKIPAQIENLNDDKLEENVNVEEKGNQKAVRKAMKRAKKEAKRKIILRSSPDISSPRYSAGGSSPRYTVGSASPRHGLGNHSPRYVPAVETNTPKKRKHKMKHKKKHKEDKDRKHSKDGEGNNTEEEVSKEPFLTQKLSINLKRLSTSYAAQMSSEEKMEESSSDESSENSTIMLPVSETGESIESATGAEGFTIKVGDIIWGKMHGFSWWPGKILKITICENEEPRAWISWYGTTELKSVIQCNQLSPYLDCFKTHYNKKARGGYYKDAIKQASMEARLNAEQSENVSSSPRSITPVVPPALASPREINVIS